MKAKMATKELRSVAIHILLKTESLDNAILAF